MAQERIGVPFDFDIFLVEKARMGDREAVEKLIEKFRPQVRRVALEILHSDDDADEVMIDVLARLPKSILKFEAKSKFATWLHQVVRNRAISKLRTQRENHDLSENEHQDPVLIEIPPELAARIERLSALDRDVLRLRTEGLRHREIAEQIGGTESSVKTRFHRLRKRLAHAPRD